MSDIKRITLRDIAADTGYTAQAVSRALRGKADISEETRRIINDAADRLGYIKNMTANSLRNGFSRSIAIVYDYIINPYYSIMTDYLHKVLKQLGYTLVMFTSESKYLDESLLNDLVSRNMDGVISFLEPDSNIENLSLKYKIPVMVLGRNGHGIIDSILTDDIDGGAKAARRLLDGNCRKIMHITETLNITCAVERYNGFRNELEKENLFDEDIVLILEGCSVEEKLGAFLETGKAIDGIFAFNDMLAYEVLYVLEKAGISGIKVIGYDNIQENIKLPHRLTTIGADKQQMAEVAAHVLVRKIEHLSQRSFKKIHEVFVVEGDTC